MVKLDYTLNSPEERNELVKKYLEENPNPTDMYKEYLADYLILCMEKQEKKEKKILTENRMMTVNKRETSYEGLVSQLESGEDGIYNLVHEDKQQIFQPKVKITKKDLDEIPDLRQLRNAIEIWETKLKTAQGRDAFIIKKALIELRKDQYIIKNAFRRPVELAQITRSNSYIKLDDLTCAFDDKGMPIPQGISLMDYKIVSAILCNYSALKQGCWDHFEGDTWYLMQDFDKLSDIALQEYPLYERIVDLKIDGVQNVDIQNTIFKEFGIKHSLEYISSLWRNKIPKLIADAAIDQYLDWYYLNIERGKYKRCSRCGQIKLAHNKYFSKNKTSKDGWYSICKHCRNAKARKESQGEKL